MLLLCLHVHKLLAVLRSCHFMPAAAAAAAAFGMLLSKLFMPAAAVGNEGTHQQC
jgi:hypothetical protein